MSDCDCDAHRGDPTALLDTASSARGSYGNSGDNSPDHWDESKDAQKVSTSASRQRAGGVWTADEHDRFLKGMQRFPIGPWSAIAAVVGTRSVRQVHSHAQKYAAKVERHKRGHGKMKRSMIAGGEGSPSGHRVVPKIPGKFNSQAELLADQKEDHGSTEEDEILDGATRRSFGGLTNEKHLLEALTRNESRLSTPAKPTGRKQKSQKNFRSQFSQPRSPPHRETQVRGPADTRSLRHANNDATEIPLPSLEESLDFFIMTLDEPHRG